MYEGSDLFYQVSGFCVMASEASGHELWKQLEEANLFLKQHGDEIAKIKGIEEATLDFGYFCQLGEDPDGGVIISHGEHIEPSLLKRCGDLGIGISLSLYPVQEDENEITDDSDCSYKLNNRPEI